MTTRLKDIGEFDVIRQLARGCRTKDRSVVCGIGDDTAVLRLAGSQHVLLTTDMLVEGVHFRPETPAQAVGHKALAVNISDIAAMGGRPGHAVVSLGLRPETPVEDVKALYAGMNRLARRFGVQIVGGDTVRARKLTVSVSLLGRVSARDLVLRSGARVGDILCVSGPLGRSWTQGRDLRFIPRVKRMQQLLTSGCRPSAAIDISDGLLSDLEHILRASGVGAVLERDRIPKVQGATWQQACTDGEDYELLLSLPPARFRKLKDGGTGLRWCRPIGEVTAQAGTITMQDRAGRPVTLPQTGFTHFKRSC